MVKITEAASTPRRLALPPMNATISSVTVVEVENESGQTTVWNWAANTPATAEKAAAIANAVSKIVREEAVRCSQDRIVAHSLEGEA